MVRPVYSGDVNIEYGGTWYKIDPTGWDEYGYCSAIRVTPCSDAGAQSNAWWIEELTVIKPNPDEVRDILNASGFYIDENGAIVSCYAGDILAEKGTAQFRWVMAECCVSYGRYDIDRSETVQIGRKAEETDEHAEEPDTVLRADASLERYVKRNFVAGM